LNKEVISFGGTLARLGDHLPSLSSWTLAFGGLDVTYPTLDVIDETRDLMEEGLTWRFVTCIMMEGLWMPSVALPLPNISLCEPNITQEGHEITLLRDILM